jgi:hypothetical protein
MRLQSRTAYINVRVDPELARRLADRARGEGVTISHLMRRAATIVVTERAA